MKSDTGRRAAGLLFALLILAAPALCGPLSLGTFAQFSYTSAGTPATGCFPNDPDPNALICSGSSGTPTAFLDAPPWTFSSPSDAVFLTVVDAFEAGDRFEVFDFGASLGLTSLPASSFDCGDDPVVCLASPDTSKAVFLLPAGDHSITIVPTLVPSGSGTGYLQAQVVPEPSTWLILGSGLVALAFARNRKRRALIRTRALVPAVALVVAATVWHKGTAIAQPNPLRFSGPTSSQPLALMRSWPPSILTTTA